MQMRQILTLATVLSVLLSIGPARLTNAGEPPPAPGGIGAQGVNEPPTADPTLSPLGGSGGLAKTPRFLPGSPTIDVGDDSAWSAADRRDVHRPQGATYDVRTYELQQQVEWRDVCAPHRIEITGIGMGGRDNTANPRTMSLADPEGIGGLLAQVAGRLHADAPTPESVTFTTDAPESITLTAPTSETPWGYTFEKDLQSTSQITASVNNPGDTYKTPRALVLYAKRATEELWTSVGETMNEYAYAGRREYTHTEVLAFPPLTEPTDLTVTAVVIDNDEDSRPMVVEATAGGVSERLSEQKPTDGVGLNIVTLMLPQVLTGTDRISVTLQSPPENGDSLVLVGLNVGYQCAGEPEPCLRIRKVLEGVFTDPCYPGDDLAEPTPLIHVSDQVGPSWTSRFHMTIDVENCGYVDLDDVKVTDIITGQVAAQAVLDPSGDCEDLLVSDTITCHINMLPAGQSAYVELLIETVQDPTTGQYAPTLPDQDIGFNTGATVQATALGFGTGFTTTEPITLTLVPTTVLTDISKITPTLPYTTPWEYATWEEAPFEGDIVK